MPTCTLCAAEESPGFYTGCMVRDGHAPEWDCDGQGNLSRRDFRKALDSFYEGCRRKPHSEEKAARIVRAGADGKTRV